MTPIESILIAVFGFLTAGMGFGSAVLVTIRTARTERKVAQTHEAVSHAGMELAEVHVLVNGNLRRVQEQLAETVALLEEERTQGHRRRRNDLRTPAVIEYEEEE